VQEMSCGCALASGLAAATPYITNNIIDTEALLSHLKLVCHASKESRPGRSE